MLTEADHHATEAFIDVEPAWTGMRSAADALGLETHTMLHSGPPAIPAHTLVKPILNSAAVACVFEGWADNLDDALEMVRSGSIKFMPAQDHLVATPMAAVVSPSMQVIEMTDLRGRAHPCYAPINGGGHGGSPVPRYGRRAPECVEFLRFLNGAVAELLHDVSGEPLPWLPLIDHALVGGDDTHLRHVAAHTRLVETLDARRPGKHSNIDADSFIRQSPFFHLNFWMAAVRCVLDGASGVRSSSIVTAFGGNGNTFGLQVSGFPGRWFTAAATAPVGKLRDGFTTNDTTGAFGDSAIIEAFGLGALAHHYSPPMQEMFAGHRHCDLLQLPAKLLAARHPRLHKSRARVGLVARNVIAQGVTPVVELGIVDRDGEAGGLGAGLYRPRLEPFASACAALDTS